MSEFKPDHDPVIWKLFESLFVGVLIVVAIVIALGQAAYEAVRNWWTGR